MWVVAALSVATAVLVVRLRLDAAARLREARADLRAQAWESAIADYGDAARRYVPGPGPARTALDELVGLARGWQVRGDEALARRGWEEVRAAALGTRSFLRGYEDALLEANAALARLYAAADPGASQGWYAARLAVRPGPRPAAASVALGGLALWLGALVLFVRRGLDPGLRLRRRAALTGAVLGGVGLLLFVVGLRLA